METRVSLKYFVNCCRSHRANICSWKNIPMIYSQNIRKMFTMKFWGIFPNNVPGILFVKYSRNIPMMYSQNIREKFPMKFRGTFRNNVPGILFAGYSRNIPMIYSQNIRKKFPMKFQGIFLNNVPGILNIGIFPDCSKSILRMLHALF